jgi:hypothetical protein
MDSESAHSDESRPATVTDLVQICRSLNAEGARYIVVGGFAVNQHGFARVTTDIDLLIDCSPENQRKVKKALEVLPDRAVRELADDDLSAYAVIRVSDEVVVDLMSSACGVRFDDSANEIETHIVDGVPIPFASAALLLKTKQTYREKDGQDRLYLEHRVAELKRKSRES